MNTLYHKDLFWGSIIMPDPDKGDSSLAVIIRNTDFSGGYDFLDPMCLWNLF